RLLDLVLMVDVTVRQPPRRPPLLPLGPDEIEHVLLPLEIHREPLEPVSDLPGDRVAVDAADLLKVGELSDLHAVQPYFPTETPRAERGILPIILDEADVVSL